MVFPKHRFSETEQPHYFRLIGLPFLALCLLCFASCKNKSSPASEHVAWDNSKLQGSPEASPPYVARRAFPELPLHQPVALKQEPLTGNLLLLQIEDMEQRYSTLKRFVQNKEVREAETLLELSALAYSIAFHPQYERNGFIYVGLNSPSPGGINHSRIIRYTIDIHGSQLLILGSAFTIIEWPSNGHNGAAICFGNDGMLYVTSGDGTNLMDLDKVAQDLTTLLGKVLRLDVDGADPEQGYRVPQDNPFVGMENIRQETWAYGLRNPWRITSDPESGQIWVGQNGQDLREFAHLLARGANYGWSAYEGSRVFMKDRLQGPSPFTPPTIEHDHSEFRSLTGGIVYRGSRFPNLEGAYIYGDYTTGRIWAAKHDGVKLLWNRELADTNLAITDFTTTTAGDILVIDHTGHGIYRLDPSSFQAKTRSEFPKKLSETGLFSSTPELIPAAGVLPYEINAPGWHDGAESKLLLALPGKSKARFVNWNSSKAHWFTWDLPDKTALAQTLVETGSGIRLETRILLKQENDWAAYSYVWNKEQNDAILAPKAGKRLRTEEHDWLVPSRAECLVCHSRQAKFVLSLTNAQLNREVLMKGQEVNQLTDLVNLGVVLASGGENYTLPTPLSEIPRLVDPYDESAELSQRVQAYFAVNCSHCHTPNGGGNSRLNLGPWVNFTEQHLIDAPPEHDHFGIADAGLIAPGHPERSVLPIRMALRGPGQIPPLGTLYPDTEGIQLLIEWQMSLTEIK